MGFMGDLGLATEKADLLGRAGEWTVFCAPGDAPPITNISLSTVDGRRPRALEYVAVGTTRQLIYAPLLSVRVEASRAALDVLGMAEDGRGWRVLALAVVDDDRGEVYLAQYLPAAKVWSVESRPAVGGGELVDLVLVGDVADGEPEYRRIWSGPGWVARCVGVV